MAKRTSPASRFFTNKHGRVVVFQKPNVPIMMWFVCKVLAYVATTEHAKHALSTLSTAFLFTWAYLELTKGGSYFRMLLGLVVLVSTVFTIFN